MEITGFDNVFYSNINFEDIISDFEAEIEFFWPNAIVNIEQMPDSLKATERHERFYSKNQEMLSVHEEYGFNTRLKNEGCLYLIAVKQRQYDLKIRVDQEIEPKSEFAGPDPYDSKIILIDGWQYTLVTPESIDKVGFSKSVFDKLIDCIKKRQANKV